MCVCVCVCISLSFSVFVCVLFVCPTLRRQCQLVSTLEGRTTQKGLKLRRLARFQVDDGFMDVGTLAHVSRTRVVSLFDQVKKSYVAPRTGPGFVELVAGTLVVL